VLKHYKQDKFGARGSEDSVKKVGWLVSEFEGCCCEKLAAEARDSSGTQGKGNVRGLKPIRSNGNEDVTVGTSVCVCVCVCVCVQSRAITESPIIPVINLNPVYSHSIREPIFIF
jgi:hypothetical protein